MKITNFILIVVFLFSLPLFALIKQKITVYINNEKIKFDAEPVLVNRRTMVPMSDIFERLGATVDWNDSTSTALVIKGNISISITIDSPFMIDGNMKPVFLDSPAVFHNNRTLVPLRAVAEAFNFIVQWDEATSTVYIYDNTAPPQASEHFNFPRI